MARYFEEDEEPEFEEPRHDTEVTLSWGALVGIALGLLAICAVCFGLGYMVGHSGRSNAVPAAPSASQQNAPDQEPLLGSGSVPKPSAAAQAAVPRLRKQTRTHDPPRKVAGVRRAAAPGPAQGATPVTAPAAASPASPLVKPALARNCSREFAGSSRSECTPGVAVSERPDGAGGGGGRTAKTLVF